MKTDPTLNPLPEPSYDRPDDDQLIEPLGYDFGLSRRSFVQILGTGLLIAVSVPALAQERERRRGRGRRANGARTIAARVHLGRDGSITVMTGKVEAGQGARTELTQAAAEEMRVAPGRIQLVMSDTSTVPDDGITAGSRTTPSTVPAVREGTAAARELLVDFAAKQWKVPRSTVEIRDGKAIHSGGNQSLDYGDLARNEDATREFDQPISSSVELTPVKQWKVLGTSVPRPNGRGIVTGTHEYPSDIKQPGMLYGGVLRRPSYSAKLVSIDLGPARALKDVVVVRDEDFVGVAAPTSFQARQAVEALVKGARWESSAFPSSKELFDYLREHADGGVPSNPFADELARAKTVLRQSYQVAYAQHAPLEPRAAVAVWNNDTLTVWTGTQNPFGVRSELTRAFHLPDARVRVIVPDFGAGFGGKHTGEAAIEAARLARVAKRPVSLRWTRDEEFTWAYFRPAAAIEIQAGLDGQGMISSWHYVNINSGRAAIDTPYRISRTRCQFVRSAPPLRQGSYRALAATANNFARESFMDELAAAAKADPLEFRLAHLDNPRLRAVLEAAAQSFRWKDRVKQKAADRGVGLACGTEKGSYVAACAEIAIDRKEGLISVRHVSQAFECGAILNPDNLLNQVQGAIIMGLGPALREAVRFENGKNLTHSFGNYRVPRFEDAPTLDLHLLNRPDLPSAGAGETPIMAIAPAIANAVYHATGVRVHEMPIRLPQGA